MFVVPKKVLQKSNSETSFRRNDTIYDKIRSYMTLREINANPILSSALTQEKKIMFSLLTSNKSKMTSTKGLKSEKKQRLVEHINSFRKSYFNYFRNYKYSMDEITNLSKQNSIFIKKYHEMEEKSGLKNQDKFEEIRKEYNKKNYNLPTIEGNKNLFGGSLLLSNNETDLKKYIMYGVGSQNSNKKSISYLNKVNEDINEKSQREGKKSKIPLGLVKGNITRRGGVIVPSPVYAYYKISNESIKEILDYQNDIHNLKKCIESIPEIDYFFDADNKTYLDSLKFFDSRKSSANFSTGVNLERTSGSGKVNSSFYSRKEFNGSNSSSLRNISRITYNADDKDKNNIKRVNFNPNTMSSFIDNKKDKNGQLIKDEIPSLTHIIKKPKKKKRMSVTNNIKNQTKMLETLYKQISKSFDTVPFNKKIEKYLKLRKYEILPKLSPNNICNNFESIRDKVCKGKTMKKMIELRKNFGDNQSTIEQVNRIEVITTKNMNDIEDKMIKVFSGF